MGLPFNKKISGTRPEIFLLRYPPGKPVKGSPDATFYEFSITL